MTHDVLTMGVFDGVHKGHQALIQRAREEADKRGGQLIAMTFDPHPREVLMKTEPPKMLCSVSDRVGLLLDAGVDVVEVLDFNEEMAATTAEEFVHKSFSDGIEAVVLGSNFRFGKGANGNADTLKAMGFDAYTVDLQGEGDHTWSSTFIRGLIEEGNVKDIPSALGRRHWVNGPVVHGDKRGRELGFPTANVAVKKNIAVPREGVYAGYLIDQDTRYPAAISIGTNPQFEGTEFRVEAYAIDQTDLSIYDHPVRVEFVERLRGQATFPSLEIFISQMGNDVDQARDLLTIA